MADVVDGWVRLAPAEELRAALTRVLARDPELAEIVLQARPAVPPLVCRVCGHAGSGHDLDGCSDCACGMPYGVVCGMPYGVVAVRRTDR